MCLSVPIWSDVVCTHSFHSGSLLVWECFFNFFFFFLLNVWCYMTTFKMSFKKILHSCYIYFLSCSLSQIFSDKCSEPEKSCSNWSPVAMTSGGTLDNCALEGEKESRQQVTWITHFCLTQSWLFNNDAHYNFIRLPFCSCFDLEKPYWQRSCAVCLTLAQLQLYHL